MLESILNIPLLTESVAVAAVMCLLGWLFYRAKKSSFLQLKVVGRADFGAFFTLQLRRPWYLRWLKLPAFQAGQSVQVRLPHEMAMRRYSLARWQKNPHEYELAIKCEPNGYFSPRLSSYAQVGAGLQLSLPSGQFVLPQTTYHHRAVMIAGGIGITPLLAMIEQWLFKQTGYSEIFLFWQVRHEQDAFYRDVLNLFSQHNLRVRILVSQPRYSTAEKVNMTLLKKEVGELSSCDFFLCASGVFLESFIHSLHEANVNDHAIFYERFTLAAGVVEGSSYNVEYEGKCFAFTGYRTLLEACEAQGLPVKSDCRSGFCGVCTTRLCQGEVQYLSKPESHISDGEVLICCSVPKSHVRLGVR